MEYNEHLKMMVENLKSNLSVKKRWRKDINEFQTAYNMHMAYNMYQIFSFLLYFYFPIMLTFICYFFGGKYRISHYESSMYIYIEILEGFCPV